MIDQDDSELDSLENWVRARVLWLHKAGDAEKNNQHYYEGGIS